MPRTYPAKVLDGWSLAEVDVQVEPHAGGLRILDAQGALRGEWSRMQLQTDGMQGGVLHVTRGDASNETLVVHDAQLQRAVLAISPKHDASSVSGRQLAFIAVVLAAIAALAAGAYFATPQLARAVAMRIPLEDERALGAQVETALGFSRCSDAAAQESLGLLTRELVKHDGAQVEVRLMDSDMPNAFALPGGLVLVTTTFLHQAESEAEIAGVLAHEIEHVVQRHVLTGFLRDTMLSALWALTIGDYAGLLVVDPTTAYRIASLQFPRADEEAADRGAVTRLHRAGLSHKGMAAFFSRMQKEHGGAEGPAWLSTHPATGDRIAALQHERDVHEPKRVLTDTQLAALKAACKAGKSAPAP